MESLRDTLARLFNHLQHNDDEVGLALAEKAIELSVWISVNDRLPIKGGEYLVTDGTSQMVALFDQSGVWDFYDNNTWWYSEDVTHWMPLNKSPLQ